ncbi:MAG: putative Ig domain-containing protein [Dehalococcoidia bacterium]|nr:putative Ig domain-containing protein [Dehalococcoidia bacterium]
MRTSNFGENRRAAGFFRLFLGIIVALTLALGGMVLNPRPAQAIGITADPVPPIDVPECQPFTIQFTANGTTCTPPPDPYFWFWPALPTWVDLDLNTGLLTGCPDPGSSAGSPYIFFVGVSEFSPPFCGPFTNAMLVTINVTPNVPACDMVIDPTFYPVAWENLPFSMTLSVTGGVGPFNWSAVGLPAGLSVTDPVNGIISGTPGPGTCGTYTVTATVTDTGICTSCCPSVNRDFILIVDCWANYPIIFYYTTACDFDVEIGPGLTQGQTNVLVDGAHEATLIGGQSQSFTSVPCESHLVMVDQTVQVPNSNIKFTVIGSNTKTVTDVDNHAYFNYAQEIYIQTSSEPSGVAQPPGTGFYAVGSNFSSTTPGTIETDIQNGIKYVFREWKLPDGSTRPTRDLVFTVNQGGTATAAYDTFYLLTLKSDYPSIDERSWERQGSTATWNLSLHAVPLLGFWGFLGGVQSPLNASGSQLITGPTTVEIMWGPNYTMPIIAIVIILLVIAGLVYLIYRLRGRPATRPATPETKAPAKAKPAANSGFCPKCGNRVRKDEDFCKKCGKKLK